LADLREGETLDPLDSWIHCNWSTVLKASGHYEEALGAADRCIAFSPGHPWARFWRGVVLYSLKRWEESIAPLQKGCDTFSNQLTCAYHAMALHRVGQIDQARVVAHKAMAMATTGDGIYLLAAYQVLTGDSQEALRLLKQAIDLGAGNTPRKITEMVRGQDFQPLRDDPEFKSILADLRSRLTKH
jgi:tetratricopeptide (TPR) repeat protein